MAKKKESLSFEERLEKVLVPDWEKPYKVPSNWVWARGSAVFLQTESKKPTGEDFFYIDIDSIDNTNQKVKEPKKLKVSKAPSRANRGLKNGDTLFSLVRPYLKNIAYISEEHEVAIASTGFYVCRPNGLNPKFIYWLMCSGYVVDGLNKFMKGDNSPSIRKDDIENFRYPLPPLAEQQRIVDRIESLFSKLDEAKEKVQTSLDSFEKRKTSILHKAFTGELTKKWREENGVSLDSWEKVALQDVCEKITCGKTPTDSISLKGDVPFLKVYNIVNNAIDFDYKPQYIPSEISESKLKSSILLPRDIVMNIVGPPLRKIAIIPDTHPMWNMNQAIVRFRPKERLISKFLYYALIYPNTLDDVIADTKGVVGQANISVTQSRKLKIALPNILEQNEIVRILDSIFEKEQQAKELANVIAKIDLMKKAILARAFRGELGTNDLEEESAMELLKEILEVKF